jgi:hypothetical protein
MTTMETQVDINEIEPEKLEKIKFDSKHIYTNKKKIELDGHQICCFI